MFGNSQRAAMILAFDKNAGQQQPLFVSSNFNSEQSLMTQTPGPPFTNMV